MSQPTLQIPALQTSPVPQVVPFVTLLAESVHVGVPELHEIVPV